MDPQDDLEHFSLRWNNYNDTMKTGFHDLLKREDFVDVTIAVEGKLIQAHKMVLSICSPYFKTIFKTNPCQHPVVFLKDVTHREITGILQFMYLGEVSITQEDLVGFLKTAEALQIKGLSSEDVEQAFPPLGPPEDEDEKKINILPPPDGENDDRNTPKTSLLRNEDEDDDDDDGDDDGDDDDNEDDNGDNGDDDDGDDDTGVHAHEPKKMKMSPANEGPAPIDPHVPVIRPPERPVISSNTQPPQVTRKDAASQFNGNAAECERTSVVREVAGNGVNQGSDDREDLAEQIMDSLTVGNEIAQEVNNLQPVAELQASGENQQGTAAPTVLKKNQGLCPICGRILQHKKNLQTHILDQHTGIFGCWPCQICHRVCRTWSALRVHTNRHHLNLPPSAVQMSIIGIAQESN